MEKASEGKAVCLRRHTKESSLAFLWVHATQDSSAKEHWSSYLGHIRPWQNPDYVKVSDRARAWPHLCSDTFASTQTGTGWQNTGLQYARNPLKMFEERKLNTIISFYGVRDGQRIFSTVWHVCEWSGSRISEKTEGFPVRVTFSFRSEFCWFTWKQREKQTTG